MSPQSSLIDNNESSEMNNRQCNDVCSMSNSQIAQAADVAFSHHKRLDADFLRSNDVACNPLECSSSSNCRFSLRKRKKSFEPVSFDAFGMNSNTDFISAIFSDLQHANASSGNHADNNGYENPSTSPPSNDVTHVSDPEFSRPAKKSKISMSRSRKSFSRLPNVSSLRDINQTVSMSPNGDAQDSPRKLVSLDGSYFSSDTIVSDANVDTNLIHNIVDKVLIESLIFPCLPNTVSSSSCSSNNLTQTSVHAAQVLENPPSKTLTVGGEHDKGIDTYGWFVDVDLDDGSDRTDAISDAIEKNRKTDSINQLSFETFTAPKKTNGLDEEVEWAKAADTVDDVLGDFF